MNKLRELLSKQETISLMQAKRNEDYCAHIYLGNMYLALSRFDLAEQEYLRAEAVRSTPETKANLANVRRLRAALRSSAAGNIQSSAGRAA